VNSEEKIGGEVERPIRGRVARFVQETQASGRLTFSTQEVGQTVGIQGRNLYAALRRQALSGSITRVSRGLFLIVPPEYRSSGAPPVEWWLGDLMAHLGLPYYLGLLSAAEAHGSSHFALMETQIVAARWIRPIDIGQIRLRFFQKARVESTPKEQRSNRWATLAISSPEATVLDLLNRRVCGIGRTSMIVSDLMQSFGKRRLRKALESADDTPAAQRLGFLLQHLGNEAMAAVVERWLVKQHPRMVDLEPGDPAEGRTNTRWRVRINARLEQSG
jgi:predicted transcriptional regulator of viral defense system